jgi:hypothetical protein
MAAFDGNGFAAVDAFFGGSSTTVSTTTAAPSETQQAQGPKRLGLGADAGAKERKNDLSASNPLTKRLLQVGTKRKLSQKRDADDYDDDDEQPLTKDDDNDDDGEEDGGRTAIEERVLAVVPAAAAIEAATKAAGKKKKKGKKERQKESADPAEATKEKTNEETEETGDDEKKTPQKQKRRKIRSRQKNIYKDNRSKKPSHLIPGKRNYEGRPMTLETRQKLNLPLEKAPAGKDAWSSNWNDDQAKDGDGVDAMPLAVDAVNGQPNEEKRQKKKAKKSRFKNLR